MRKKSFIKSLALVNFQKYKNTIFTFSPQGNLITGLNGSGKSTVAAAIVLALGGACKTLGKALAAHELIRYGETKATLEIVIKTDRRKEISEIVKINGKEMEIEVAISRTITATGSTYKINNIPASQNQIKEVTEALSIQVNSLAQFLPQDRVTEFSGLAEEEKLDITLKTCNAELLKKKKELEEIDDNLLQYKQSMNVQLEKQNHLKAKIKELEEERKKLKEFLDRKQQISLLQSKIKWVEYLTLKSQCDKLKANLEKEQETCSRKEQEIAQLIEMYDEEKEKLTIQEEKHKSIPKIHSFIQGVEEIKKNEEEERKTEEKIALIQGRMHRIDQEMFEIKQWKEPKETERPKQKLTEHLKKELDALESENRQEKMQDSSWQIESAMKAEEIKNIEISIKKEEERETRMMEALKIIHKDTYTTIKLMESSGKKWKVDMPAILTMKIVKNEYKREISSQLNIHALTCFVCHTPEAFQEFVQEFKIKNNLAINVVEKQNCAQTKDAAHASQRTQEEMVLDSKYKMIYLSDCIEAPPAVKEFLNIFSKLQVTPATKLRLADEHEFFSRYRRISRIISNERVIEIKRSPYTKDETLSIYPMAKGIDILTKPQDIKLKEKLEELKTEREQRTQKRQEVLRRREAIEKRIKELALLRETDAHENERYERQKRATQANRERAEEIKKESQMLKSKEKEASDELKRIRAEGKKPWNKLPLSSILKSILEISEKSKSMQVLREELDKIKHSILTQKQALKECQKKSLETEQKIGELKTKARQKHAEANAIQEITPESDMIKKKLSDLPKCINTLTSLLAQEKAKAELSIVDYAAIDNYEECKASLQSQEKILRKEENEKAKHEAVKKQKEADLKAEIQALVGSINENASLLFAIAGIKAEVLVDYAESPRRWKLILKVQFRAEGRLEVLSADRHSGGEKAVSIILYLLSMQSLSEAPLLVVDEINQGMDSAHEKIVHSMLVGSKSSSEKQTIVITPKLTFGLDYSPSTKVHVIIETI